MEHRLQRNRPEIDDHKGLREDLLLTYVTTCVSNPLFLRSIAPLTSNEKPKPNLNSISKECKAPSINGPSVRDGHFMSDSSRCGTGRQPGHSRRTSATVCLPSRPLPRKAQGVMPRTQQITTSFASCCTELAYSPSSPTCARSIDCRKTVEDCHQEMSENQSALTNATSHHTYTKNAGRDPSHPIFLRMRHDSTRRTAGHTHSQRRLAFLASLSCAMN